MTALLQGGADADARSGGSRTPLHFAALEGHADTVRSLAVCGSNVNAADEKGATALHKAAAGGHIEVQQRAQVRPFPAALWRWQQPVSE